MPPAVSIKNMTIKTRHITYAARLLSWIFRPYYLPLVGFISLFSLTYLRLLPIGYKLYVLATVYVFTIFFPVAGAWVYRKINGWAAHHLRMRENRGVPYMWSIISYAACLYIMQQLHLPHYMQGIIISALFIQLLCAAINIWWKISTHAAGAGGIIGALAAYSLMFMFNPVKWLCILIILAGLVGSSRMWLRQHTLAQIVVGTLIGVVCGFFGIIF